MSQEEIIFDVDEARQSIAALRSMVQVITERMNDIYSLLEFSRFEHRMVWFEPKYNPGFGPEDKRYPYLLGKVWSEYSGKGYNGITDPVVIEYIRRWEDDGVAGWPYVNADDLEIILDRIYETNSGRMEDEELMNLVNDASALFFGGYDILGETDMNRFFTALHHINQNIGDLPVGCIRPGTWMSLMQISDEDGEW